MQLATEIHRIVQTALMRRPAAAHGTLVDYDPRRRLGVVRFPNPAGEGDLTLPNLYVPTAAYGIVGGDPHVGDQVTLTLPNGSPAFAEITAVRPRTQEFQPIVRDRTPVATLAGRRTLL